MFGGSRALVLGLSLAAASPVSSVSPVFPIAWRDGIFEHRADVAPGKFLEVCAKLDPGDRIRWFFEGGASLDFNIHYHEERELRYPARQDAVSKLDGTLDVTLPQDYCWMWANHNGDAVPLRLLLQRR